ncbi:MAG: phosphatase PAP2 family protein [Verrucomicrobiales bacterium]|nr:phosphatase PAP2 family protein [Verrucomicrobiales bacterium]MCP5559924.1 phosphatase PAP2 family protein [Verrucomicrobiaceae bacterium]
MLSNIHSERSLRDVPTADAAPSESVPHAAVQTLLHLWQEAIDLCSAAFRHRRRSIVLSVGLIAIVVATLMPWDTALLKEIRLSRSSNHYPEVDGWARWLSYWGDFLGFNVLAFTLLGLAAVVRRSALLRRVVLAAVCGTLFSGLAANALRFCAGRARPSTKVAPGFYGPRLDAGYHSFPSAHTATAFGAAAPVAVAMPPVGIPMVIIAGGVAWSRMQNNRHYPTDVLLACSIATLVGVPLGRAARELKRC